MLVTDAVPALGLSVGNHTIGRMQVTVLEDKAVIAGTNTLCGSIAPMNKCVQNFYCSTGERGEGTLSFFLFFFLSFFLSFFFSFFLSFFLSFSFFFFFFFFFFFYSSHHFVVVVVLLLFLHPQCSRPLPLPSLLSVSAYAIVTTEKGTFILFTLGAEAIPRKVRKTQLFPLNGFYRK